METIVAFVDDAAHAARLLQPLGGPGTHWVLVGCAPKLTQRVSKWVSHRSREQWRARWAAQLFDRLCPQLQGAHIDTLVARQPLSELTQQLQQGHGSPLRFIDARRTRVPADVAAPRPWTAPLVLALGLVPLLGD